jgi:transposase, IS5 family
MFAAIHELEEQGKAHKVPLWRSYLEVVDHESEMAVRYSHAKQFKRAGRELRFLRICFSCLSRDIRRKAIPSPGLRQVFDLAWLCSVPTRLGTAWHFGLISALTAIGQPLH